ncbi:MAG TPA: anhydro-N-acetylmuramic acid kinase [candidate division Zixibacteria bacterium]|nr:anhydro-N-acetylmuramic acid kinase [candidate division Zixibacteria bacterium]
MTLSRLLTRKSLRILGVNSGTSADGLDFALLELSDNPRGRLRIKPLATGSASYSPEIRALALHLADTPSVAPEELALADEALGEFTGRRVRTFLRRCQKNGFTVDCIALHGQTVRHHPQRRRIANFPVNTTLQLTSPERVAALTERIVISHFRQADTALGGEGAPITTGAVAAALGGGAESRVILNLGGIANYFYLPAQRLHSQAQAVDIGPANVLLDQSAARLFGEPFDRHGARAGAGSVNTQLLRLARRICADKSTTTRSTGRERFGPAVLETILQAAGQAGLSAADTQATIAEATALTIAEQVNKLARRDRSLGVIYLTGGGLQNRDLVRRLQAALDNLVLQPISKLGYSPKFFEASCFAILGYFGLRGRPAAAAGERTSRRRAPILGRITQPPVKLSGKR